MQVQRIEHFLAVQSHRLVDLLQCFFGGRGDASSGSGLQQTISLLIEKEKKNNHLRKLGQLVHHLNRRQRLLK